MRGSMRGHPMPGSWPRRQEPSHHAAGDEPPAWHTLKNLEPSWSPEPPPSPVRGPHARGLRSSQETLDTQKEWAQEAPPPPRAFMPTNGWSSRPEHLNLGGGGGVPGGMPEQDPMRAHYETIMRHAKDCPVAGHHSRPPSRQGSRPPSRQGSRATSRPASRSASRSGSRSASRSGHRSGYSSPGSDLR